jgi:hypothetical protein
MMTNDQVYLAVGLPMLAILTSVAVNLWLVSGIREDIHEICVDMKLLAGKVYDLAAQK